MPPIPEKVQLDTSVPPAHIVVLHRLARLGKSNREAKTETMRAYQFEVTPRMADVWPELRSVERVTLLYRKKV